MNVLQKNIIFIALFSVAFHLIHLSDSYNTKILIADLGGIPWLYSCIGVLFSIIAAFAIQKEWDNWNSLVMAVKNELASLEELWLWADHFGTGIKEKTRTAIVAYLEAVILEGWEKSERGERSERTEEIIISLRNALAGLSGTNPELMPASLAVFSDLLKHHKDRLHYSARHMPENLRYILIFSAGLVVFLSLLIGVKNVWLHYIFTASIATFAYTVYEVIRDLDHPLRPGGWHLTTADYAQLLEKIRKEA